MAFKTLTDRARKDPFAFSLLNQILENQRANESAHLYEHAPDGRHNSLEVARGVAVVEWDGVSAYSLTINSTEITAVTNPAVGTVTLTLDGDYFLADQAPRITCMDDAAESVPMLAGWKITSATSITVYLRKLSALSGNTWAAADGSFAIAIHCGKYSPATSPVTAIDNAFRGNTLSNTKWNQLVQNQADLRSRILTEHTSTGGHDALEIALGYAKASYNGSAYSLAASDVVTSIASSATGIVELALPSSRYDTQYPVFVHADYARDNSGATSEVTVVNVPLGSLTATEAVFYLYAYDSGTNTWARADFNFAATLHTTL